MNVFEAIKKFNADARINHLHTVYESNTFLGCLSTSRREQSHSTFLAELFKDDSFHGAGTLPLQLLLEAVLSRAIKQDTRLLESKKKKVYFPSLAGAIMARNLSISDVEVSTEESFTDNGSNSGRVDIFISCRVKPLKRDDGKSVEYLNIIIENKVYSKEQDSQTQKYYDHFNAFLKNKASKRVDISTRRGGPRALYNLYVYLTPTTPNEIDSLKAPECECKEFVQISYQDILDHVLDPLLDLNQLMPRGRFFIEEYRRSLGVSFENIELSDCRYVKTNATIMAIGRHNAKEIKKLWDDYQDLFTASINERNRLDDADDDETCTRCANKRVLYDYKGQPFYRGRLVEAIIQDYLPGYTLDEINEQFKSIVGKIVTKEVNGSYFDINEEITTKDSHSVGVFKQWTENRQYKFSDFCKRVKELWGCDIVEYKEESYSEEDTLMLVEFYDKHEKLIRTVLEILMYSGSAPSEVDAIVKRTTSHRNRDTYSVTLHKNNEIRHKLSWGRLVLTVLQDYVSDNSVSKDELCSNFGLKKATLKEYIADAKGGYSGYFEDEELTLSDGKNYLVNKGYTKEEIEKFIQKATKMQYRIQKTIK